MGPGGQLVHEQAAVGGQEEFDRENADGPERLGDRECQLPGFERARGTPWRLRKVFSRSRFWLTQTVRQPGRVGRVRDSHRRPGAETFSNSTVTASARSANDRRAGKWSGRPTTVQ